MIQFDEHIFENGVKPRDNITILSSWLSHSQESQEFCFFETDWVLDGLVSNCPTWNIPKKNPQSQQFMKRFLSFVFF